MAANEMPTKGMATDKTSSLPSIKRTQMPVVLVGEWHSGEKNYEYATAILRMLEPIYVTIERMPGSDYVEYHKRVAGKSVDDVATVRNWLKRTDGTLLAGIDYALDSKKPRTALSCVDSLVGNHTDADASLQTPWERSVLNRPLDENGSFPDSEVTEVLDAYRNGSARHSEETKRAWHMEERNKEMSTVIRNLGQQGIVVHFSGAAHVYGLSPTLGDMLKDCPVKNVLLDKKGQADLYDMYTWQRDECTKARNK